MQTIVNNLRNLKRIIAFIAGLVAIIASITTQAQDKSLLWRVSGNNLTKPSFLFGTIHLICPDDYIWTDKMKASLEQSEKVCFEMDLSDPGIMMRAMAGMMDSSGKRLEEYFTTDQYKLLARYIKDSLNLDLALFEKMKPVMLETFISSGNINCPDPVSYEERIMKTAQAEGKKIMGLEDAKDQIADLEQIPTATVIKNLMEDIQNSGKADTDYAQLVAAYRAQDLPALYNLIMNSPDLEDEKGPLLDDRNKKWVVQMANEMERNSIFFAVGAGHLYGPVGVIALLRKKGYTVKPL